MLTSELQVRGRGKELTGNGLEVDLLVLPKQFPPTAGQSQIHEPAGAFLIQTIAGACSDPAEYRLGTVRMQLWDLRSVSLQCNKILGFHYP